jgi:hypothetical protein
LAALAVEVEALMVGLELLDKDIVEETSLVLEAVTTLTRGVQLAVEALEAKELMAGMTLEDELVEQELLRP